MCPAPFAELSTQALELVKLQIGLVGEEDLGVQACVFAICEFLAKPAEAAGFL